MQVSDTWEGGRIAAYVWDYAGKMELMRFFWDAAVAPIYIPTPFANFDDYWKPFLGGQGPAPAYAMSLDENARARLRDRVRARVPAQADGSMSLTARARAIRATVEN